MKTLELRDGFYWAGIVDDNLRVFDIIMYTEFGTTYNSYVWKVGDKVVLFETAKEKFFDEYLDKLKEIIDVTKIDYLIVDHTEPDHAGSIGRLLEYSPQMKIVATGCAIGFLKEIVNHDFTSIAVKDNQTMEIGGKTLRFLVVPNLHWPDTMYTYIEEEQLLVTCDSFGSHYGFHDVLASKVTDQEGYMRATKYYFDCIIGPFKPFMLKALDKVRQLDVSMICPGHGPARTVTTTVTVTGGKIPAVSVRTRTDIPKEKIFDCIRALKGIQIPAPVHTGDIILADAAGTGVDVVATKTVELR